MLQKFPRNKKKTKQNKTKQNKTKRRNVRSCSASSSRHSVPEAPECKQHQSASFRRRDIRKHTSLIKISSCSNLINSTDLSGRDFSLWQFYERKTQPRFSKYSFSKYSSSKSVAFNQYKDEFQRVGVPHYVRHIPNGPEKSFRL